MVHISPQVAGRVARVLVKDNQEVAAGQPLLDLEPADFAARLDQARANQKSAAGTLAQARDLLQLCKAQRKATESRKVQRRDNAVNPAPTTACNEVEGAGKKLGSTGVVEGCTPAFPSRVFGQRLVAGSDRWIISNHFEYGSDPICGWRQSLRWGSVYVGKNGRAATTPVQPQGGEVLVITKIGIQRGRRHLPTRPAILDL